MPNFFISVALMICLFGERFFWHCCLFLCLKPSFVNQCKNFFIIGFFNHSSKNHRLDLVRALIWNSKVLSIQAYYCLVRALMWNSKVLSIQAYYCLVRALMWNSKVLSIQAYYCLVRALMWNSKVLSIQAYYCLVRVLMWNSKVLSIQAYYRLSLTK